jgi:hypothetical protein
MSAVPAVPEVHHHHSTGEEQPHPVGADEAPHLKVPSLADDSSFAGRERLVL